MKIKAIYDNGGKTADRYTVYFDLKNPNNGLWYGLAMNAEPFHPQGFGQHVEGALGRHNGKRITLAALPEDCKKLVKQELEDN